MCASLSLCQFAQRQNQNVPACDVEYSESILYYVRILEEPENFMEAFSVLDENERLRSIVDRQAILETRGRCRVFYLLPACIQLHLAWLLTNCDSPDAKEAWSTLIEHIP